MGWLPIALALAGFVFFVFIVNYNSIKTQEEAIRLAFFNFCQTAKARHTLLYYLQDQMQKDGISSFNEKEFHLKRYHGYLKLIRKELQSIEESKLFVEVQQPVSRELQKKLQSLQVLNHRQQLYIKVFSRKVREYNTLIASYPTAMVAKATGHQPINP